MAVSGPVRLVVAPWPGACSTTNETQRADDATRVMQTGGTVSASTQNDTLFQRSGRRSAIPSHTRESTMTNFLSAILSAILSTSLFFMLSGCVAVESGSPVAAAGNAPVLLSADIAMPAPHEPLDTTAITPFESAGASVSD